MNHLLKRLLILCFTGLTFHAAEAYHLIGGDISYECLGSGNYRFTIKIYRDCSNPRGDYFDYNAPVTIYLGDAPPYRRFVHLDVPLIQPITKLPPDASNPCLILPPNICVEEGIYEFEVFLPDTTMSYHIVYQRCCRNSTINNIQRPDQIGATYTIELTAFAQSECNNSPVFKNFPPIVICNSEPMHVDHSATDVDGDLVVYEFCSPLRGGGNGRDPESCSGFRPNPACPPPFYPVNYIVPTYTSQNPMAGNPLIRIDANTGIISGTPRVQGQFVVGVCAKEYRNGRLLSVVQRDFQFNVAWCDPTVLARLQADEVKNTDQYLIRSCGKNELTLKNLSIQQSAIKSQRWEFKIGGQTRIFSSWDATIAFPGPGEYLGKLLLNPGEQCGDTAYITVNIFPELSADFSYSYDTCKAGPVQFDDRSTVEGVAFKSWQWRFGDGGFSDYQNPRHIYKEPGEVPVTLRTTDRNGCQDELTKMVSYFPVPALLLIAPSDFVGCDPATIFFDNLSHPVDDSYRINWDFGDGVQSQVYKPTHTYSMPGVFDVSLEIISPIGCRTDTIFRQLIDIQQKPVAAFTYSPEKPTRFDRILSFTDASERAVRWEWLFPGDVFSSHRHPVFEFRDTGLQKVQLVVSHAEGCRDTAIAFIDLEPEVSFFLPNAFTPNDDSVNDLFVGKGVTEGVRSFHLTVWNRWGERIFESNNPAEAWNGRKHNSGEPVPAGAYPVTLRYTGPRGQLVEQQSTVVLVR